MFIAIDYYTFLFHQIVYMKTKNLVKNSLLLLLVWMLALGIDSLNWEIVGLSQHEFVPDFLACSQSFQSTYPLVTIVTWHGHFLLCPYFLLVRNQPFSGSQSVKPAD